MVEFKKYAKWSAVTVLILSTAGIAWYNLSGNGEQSTPSNSTQSKSTVEPAPVIANAKTVKNESDFTSKNNDNNPKTSSANVNPVSFRDNGNTDAPGSTTTTLNGTETVPTDTLNPTDTTTVNPIDCLEKVGDNKLAIETGAPPPPPKVVKKVADILKPEEDLYVDDESFKGREVTGNENIDDVFLKTTDMPLEFVYNAEISSDLENELDTRTDFNGFDPLDKLVEIPKKEGPTVGIYNSGYLCYASVVIQALYRVPFIRKIIGNLNVYLRIAEKSGKLDDNMFKSFKVLEGINYFFYQLNSETFETDKKYCMYFYPPRYRPKLVNEDDKVVSKLQTTITKAFRSKPHKYFRAFQCLPENYKFKVFGNSPQYLEFILSNIISILPKPQHNILSIVRANNVQSYFQSDELLQLRYQISTYYQVDLEVKVDGIYGVKLESLIQHFFLDKETRDNPFLSYFPDFIPISIRKDPYSNRIFAPELLDLSDYATLDNPSNNGLYSFMNIVLVHENQNGKLNGAMNHYVAYICEEDGKYYKYDDSKVNEIEKKVFEEKKNNSRALIYFYAKVNQ